MTDAVLAQRQAIDAIHGGDPALIEMLFGPPLTVVADLLRGMICAPKGRQLYVADFAAIEGRGIAWLAGEQAKLDLYARGADVYKYQAAQMFGTSPDAVDKDGRQIGKVGELALGYQGGVGAFLAMAKTYGLKIGGYYDRIWPAMQVEYREAALKAWDERGKRSGIAERTWKAAEVVKVAWRAANPRIVALWRDLEDAAIAAVQQPGTTHAAGYIRFKKAGSFLWCQLPSGRVLCYPYPSLREVTTPWGAKRTQLVYRYTDQFTKQWTEGPTYGGSLAENVTQAVARDIMAEAMQRVDTAGYEVILTVHDEVVSETAADFGSVDEFRKLMEVVPTWATGFPIAAEAWSGVRYRK